jgi:hypothetical protein
VKLGFITSQYFLNPLELFERRKHILIRNLKRNVDKKTSQKYFDKIPLLSLRRFLVTEFDYLFAP